MADDASEQERTEQPTQRRRDQAREEGKVARSQDLSAAVVILAGAATLAGSGGAALGELGIRLVRDAGSALTLGPLTPTGALAMLQDTGQAFLLAFLPFALGLAGVVGLVNLVQARGTLSAGPITPKFSHVDPVKGLGRLFSMDSVVTLLKAVAKVAVLAAVTWVTLDRAWPELLSLGELAAPDVLPAVRQVTLRLTVVTGLAFLALAAADYGWQVFRTEKSLRMTKEEVTREWRETEGDPLIKSRIQSIARQRARQRMLQQVPTADVVVTNPTHVAVALRYDPSVAPAPIVVAMGERKLAERIREVARRSGVPIVENKPVARALLATCAVGQPIAPALYAAVAEILAFVYRQRAGLPRGSGR